MSNLQDIQKSSIVAKDIVKIHESGALSIRKEYRGDEDLYFMRKYKTDDGDVYFVLEPDNVEKQSND